jgi:hypothetical protein
MKKIYFILFLILIQSSFLFAQVAINANGEAPHQSAGLDISYPDKGLLIPRMNFTQRNGIQNPAEGLIIYCTDCNTDGGGVLCIYEGSGWKSLTLKCDPPSTPMQGSQVATVNQITWDWNDVPISVGYKWNTANDFATATELGSVTTYTETNLECNTSYTRYAWAYNQCGYSTPLVLQQTTQEIAFTGSPAQGVHTATVSSIEWHWSTVPEALGYKWNTVNDYASAIDMVNSTFTLETDLLCGTNYTRYVWGYNACGHSNATTLTEATSNQPSATPLSAVHAPSSYEIIWNWHPVADAEGYKWNTINNYATATDLATDTSYVESSLSCFTPYTRYVWAYNDCGNSTVLTLNSSTTTDSHPAPTPAINIPQASQVEWKWHPLPDHPSNYKWNTTNNYSTAIDLLTDTSYTESGLSCNSSYTRYVWGYDACGVSTPIVLMATTSLDPPVNPAEAVHVPSASQIVWNWNAVSGVDGYKWNTANNYGTAQDLGASTSFTETGLTCNTNYTRYIWAYNNCGVSITTALNQMSSLDPPAEPVASTHNSFPTLIVWNWNVVSGAAGYKWNTTNNYGTAQEMGLSTTKTETGLTCNTSYTRYVWAYNACGVSTACVLGQSTAVDPPSSPIASTHVPTPSQITWNWFAVSGATGYKWNTTNDFGSALDLGAEITKIETGLTCNTNYTRYVWAYNDCGNSASVNLVQTTSLNPPASPIAAAHVPSATQIVWNWNTVSGATGYKWNTANDLATATDLGNVTTSTEAGLTCNTSYNRYVWAYSNCGTSASTTLAQVTSLNPPAVPVAGTHVVTPVQITWNWSEVSGATGYKWSSTNDYATAQDLGATTSTTETGLICNTSYTRYVWAYSNCGNSTAASLVISTTIDTPAAPVTGTHTAANTQIVWNWNTVSGATGYKWNTTNNYATATDMGTVTTMTENSLSCGTAYTRFVWAYNACANSTATSLAQTTTSTAPAAPATATHVATASQITWNWNNVSGATGYKWNTTNDYASATDVGNVTSKVETGLACFTGYTRYVWAYNSCSGSTSTTLSQTTSQDPPVAPGAGTHVPTQSQIVWNWTSVPNAEGYKWNTINTYASATEMGTSTSKTETGLTCGTSYTRYVWSYNSCGVSTSISLSQSTATDPPASPTAAEHQPAETQIVWNWNTVSGALGYKWNTTNDYGTATEMGTATTMTETGLTCGNSYSRYVWAYSNCGYSASVTLVQSTSSCWACGTNITVDHVAGNVAPVTKTTTYGTVTNVPGETTKCWISSNLGSDQQATAVNDATEASAGWYWQFNRLQGYKHDGTVRTPNTAWVSTINEYTNWTSANDPCTSQLGGTWRIPTTTEWTNVDGVGGWTNWNGPWNSALKMHAAGFLYYTTGALSYRGSDGRYWSSTQSNNSQSSCLSFISTSSQISSYPKTFGFTLRCIKD